MDIETIEIDSKAILHCFTSNIAENAAKTSFIQENTTETNAIASDS